LQARGAPRKLLVDRFLNPAARLIAGRQLARIKPAPAAIDISDGLWQDLGHVLERSGVGAEIEAGAIPLSSAYREVVGDDLELALRGGEDYELLFCVRPGHSGATLTRRLGVPVRRIGKIIRARGATLIEHNAARRKIAPRAGGWDQLRILD
jgi:thiamine-monophosphate kinase